MAQQKQGPQQGPQPAPSKETVRSWLRGEIAQRRPPPDPAQIRRELGWELIRVPSGRKR